MKPLTGKNSGQMDHFGRVSYWDSLEDITVPVMTYAAASDKNDPPAGCRKIHKRLGSTDKMFMVLGKDTGFQKITITWGWS
ncbi:MAG: hypothetical protein R2875_03855 [Desulfobacterales bacterium]